MSSIISTPSTPPVLTQVSPAPQQPLGALDVLRAAASHLNDRATTYDRPQGERSMATAVQAFNIVTGRNLSESEGWLLLTQLKLVRDRQRKKGHQDSLEDATAYAALHAEARLRE
jgi:hypothetical protein